MGDELNYDFIERIANALEGILAELKRINQPISDSKSITEHVEEKRDVAEETVSNKKKEIDFRKYLFQHGYQVINSSTVDDINPKLLRIANVMGNGYSLIEPLLKEIKRNIDVPREFSLSVKEYPLKSASAMCGLATLLKEHKLLKFYSYKKAPKFVINARANSSPQVHNFYTGQWLEYYIANSIKSIIGGRNGWKTISTNVIVKNIENTAFEFDIIVTIDEKIFWIECKTGEYKKYVAKYEKIAKELEIDGNQVFLVIAGLDEDTANALNDEHCITICNVENFKSIFESVLDSLE